MSWVALLLKRPSVAFQKEKAKANPIAFLMDKNWILTSRPDKKAGQRGLYVSKAALGEIHAGKLLNQVTWLGTMFSLNPAYLSLNPAVA